MLFDMVNIQRAPGKTELERYLRQGLTQKEIVERWEEDSGHRVSRSAIAMTISRYGLKSAHPRPTYPELIPWTLDPEHLNDADARLLRLEARRRSGAPLREVDEHWLDSWLKSLAIPGPDAPDGYVIGYIRGDGFKLVERRPHHTDIIDPPKDSSRAS